MPVTRQTHTLPTQALLTSDGRRVVVSGIVVYRIKDIVATLARNWDISDTLNDLTMVAITHVVTAPNHGRQNYKITVRELLLPSPDHNHNHGYMVPDMVPRNGAHGRGAAG